MTKRKISNYVEKRRCAIDKRRRKCSMAQVAYVRAWLHAPLTCTGCWCGCFRGLRAQSVCVPVACTDCANCMRICARRTCDRGCVCNCGCVCDGGYVRHPTHWITNEYGWKLREISESVTESAFDIYRKPFLLHFLSFSLSFKCWFHALAELISVYHLRAFTCQVA